MRNNQNKANFIQLLKHELLIIINVNVVQAPSDADTSIVETALQLKEKDAVANVQVLADDTDILCLLLHHCSTKEYDGILLRSLTASSSGSNPKPRYSIDELISRHNKSTIKYILFAHATTGSDTTSGILYNFGEKSIIQKLKDSDELREVADCFYNAEMDPDIVGQATVGAMEITFSPSREKLKLEKIRRVKYEEMVSSTRKNIETAKLPPSPRAAFYHGLRVYHQVQLSRCGGICARRTWTHYGGDGKLAPTEI